MSFFIFKQRFAPLFLTMLSYTPHSSGFNFWESSPINTALGHANGAMAFDASALASNPATISQLTQTEFQSHVMFYRVESDFSIFGDNNQYQTQNGIPSLFVTGELDSNAFLGFGIYSRTAGQLSLPQIGPDRFPLTYETVIKPIVVSVAPSFVYQWGNVSLGMTPELLIGDFHFQQIKKGLGQQKHDQFQDEEVGWSGKLSASYQGLQGLHLGISHQLTSEFGHDELHFSLPQMTMLSASLSLVQGLHIHASYTFSEWRGRGIHFEQYSDLFGLMRGFHNSKRLAIGLSYQFNDWQWMFAATNDQTIGRDQGRDARVRFGVQYQVSQQWTVQLSALKEWYQDQSFDMAGQSVVSIKNRGDGVSFGVGYRY